MVCIYKQNRGGKAMTPFLKSVAQDIYTKFNEDLADIAIVFPNKRAGLFFNEYLVQLSNRPVWCPRYMTISELFEGCTDSITGDTILLVSKLYTLYCKHTHSNESIDQFYYWGELLIKDFDDIDKNLVDADKIFANLYDLRKMGSGNDTLDEEQKAAIQQFFRNFRPEEKSELKERFLKIWEVMGNIYHDFRTTLRSEKIAYEGLLYRDAIENNDNLTFPEKKYIFVGFNALNRVESKLFDILKERNQALFYWDYDSSYTDAPHHEAGHFMRQNLKRYPNALENICTEHFSTPKNLRIVSGATDTIQTRYVPEWIKEHHEDKEIETAVILCDETKLEATLHTIPPEVENINVTMGFPIAHTPVFTLVKLLVELQTHGYDEQHNTFVLETVHKILCHPYVQQCSSNAPTLDKHICEKRLFFPELKLLQADDFLAGIFTRRTDNSMWLASIGDIIYKIASNTKNRNNKEAENNLFEELFCEALLKTFTQAQRLISILEESNMQMQQSTIGNLFMRILSMQSIPFHGEPVVGLQVMGLLETRNLDFKNIILLSANEGNLPKSSGDNSFIPYNLRRAFGLTLSEHRDSIYAYNFYRLLQRAENITLVYNNSADSATRGECSRYILQLQAVNNFNIEKVYLEAEQQNTKTTVAAVSKSDAMIKKLKHYFDFSSNKNAHEMSPTGINRYLACPMRFFYYYVMGLRKPDEIATRLEANDFGTIFHAAAENFYKQLTKGEQKIIEKSDLAPYIEKDALLYKFIDEAFNENFFKQQEGKPAYDGEQFINREVLHRFLLRLLKCDALHTPFKYIGSEQAVSFPFTIQTNRGEKIEFHIGGRVDRMDEKDGTLEIIDYKTGGKEEIPQNIEQLFAYEGKHPGYIFQSMLYCIAAVESKLALKASPSLMYIHNKSSAAREDFVVKIAGQPIKDINTHRGEFMQHMQKTLEEIFNTDVPFTPTDDKNRCEWCDYKDLCGR